jgi:predicted heme/steroid binding protein
LILSLLIFVSCQSSEPSDTDSEPVVEEEEEETTTNDEASDVMLELTLEELSEYDGKDGNRAYVAVEGVIYDVTDIDAWQNGMHNGVVAGKDLTDEIMNQSPHGTSTLSKAVEVGELIE